MKNLNDPRLRKSVYIILSALGAVLVTWGVLEQTVLDAILPSLSGLVMAGGGLLAVANTPTRAANTDNAPVQLAPYSGPSSVPAEDGGYIGRHRLGG